MVSVGYFLWDAGDFSGQLTWSRNYAALLEYCKLNGHCNVPKKAYFECDVEGLGENGGVYHYSGNLGSWLGVQRMSRKGVSGWKLNQQRTDLLQKLVDQGK